MRASLSSIAPLLAQTHPLPRGGPALMPCGLRVARSCKLLGGELENLLHLLVPIRPCVSAGQLAKLVRHLLLDEERGGVPVVGDAKVLGAAVEGEEGECLRLLAR